MKRLFLFILLAAFAFQMHAGERKMVPRYNSITKTWGTYPVVSIHDIQYVSPESLHVADSLQAVPSRWAVQRSRYYGDTVVVIAQVVVPKNIITYTQHGCTMLLRDTNETIQPWEGAFARIGDVTDTGRTDFAIPERGDIDSFTVRVDEFPLDRMNTGTQLTPIPGIKINPAGYKKPVPEPKLLNISDFYHGIYSTSGASGKVDFTNGEPYEGCLVKFYNLTVTDIIDSYRGQWNMIDESNSNTMSDYDASRYWTFASSETPPILGDPSFRLPPVGAVIDSIKGFMHVASGQQNARGYRICPLYQGDVAYGISLPSITTHRRYPVTPKSTDTVAVQVRVQMVAGGFDIGRVDLYRSINYGPWDSTQMSMITLDSIYQAYILDPDGNPWPANTLVRYFFKATDTVGNHRILANASLNAMAFDTGNGYYTYKVLDRPFTIRDVQYTPYANGRSWYVGGVVSVSGIVTGDTTTFDLTPYKGNSGGTNAWFIQNGNAPWSGIWVVKKDSLPDATLDPLLKSLRLGDSVTVTGTVQENRDFTRIADSLITIHSHGHPLPEPVIVQDSTFGEGGNAEMYESMLVKLVNTKVFSLSPIWSDPDEYSVTGPNGKEVLLRKDGKNTYSNRLSDTLTGRTHILNVGDRIDTIIGVGFFSYSRYKIVPRTDADFSGVGEPFEYKASWNMVSLGRTQYPQANYSIANLYPGAVSPAYFYSGSYVQSSVVENKKGFWIKFGSAKTIRQLGAKRTRDTITVTQGWNLIGAVANPVLVSSIVPIPDTNHLSSFFCYTGSYGVVDTLMPSKASWVKASTNGAIIVASAGIIPKYSEPAPPISSFNTITITDKDGNSQVLYFGEDAKGKLRLDDYEMPPVALPEARTFDARYSSGRILEAYPAEVRDGADFAIEVNCQNSPLTVSWNIVNEDGKKFALGDYENGKTLKTKEISGAGSVIVTKSGPTKLSLRVQGGPAIPREFSLGQNYPNPFNPSTKFMVGLPLTSHLQITVYNILGQKVATLVDEIREAGYHTIVWNGTSQNGTDVASGIYFIRMNAEKFNAVRKVMMLK